MNKKVKIVSIVASVFILMFVIISILNTNLKYHKYFYITKLDMNEQYNTEWGVVSVTGMKVYNRNDFINEYPGVESYILDTDKEIGYMVIYVTFDVTDVDKYDAEWFKMWSIEADNGWRNGKSMYINAYLNNGVKITEIGRYELCCEYNMNVGNMSLKTFDELYKIKYRVMINQNPIVYYKLEGEYI